MNAVYPLSIVVDADRVLGQKDRGIESKVNKHGHTPPREREVATRYHHNNAKRPTNNTPRRQDSAVVAR